MSSSSVNAGGSQRASWHFLVENLAFVPVVESAAVDEPAVDLAPGLFSGFTVLPTVVDPLLSSYAWVGDGGPGAPPLSVPAQIQGGSCSAAISSTFSVNLGLTDVPSLRSAPAAVTAVGGGGLLVGGHL